MAKDMWRLWFTKLLLLAALMLAAETRSEDDESLTDVRAHRLERDLQGVTTVLLVPARPGKSAPPVGLLTKTARTFVQDGASTEFATQVLGTTLDNGRLYARILSTSSRVFYEKEPTPDTPSPYLVYPSRAPSDDWQLRVALDNAPIKALKEIESPRAEESGNRNDDDDKASTKLDELSRENDIFSRREINSDSQRFKPAKVRPADNLPTFTVKHEYVASSFDNIEDEQPKNFRPRLPKIFKPQPKALAPKKPDTKPLATVTYHGFADFTTTVGETVIVFSPSTSPAPAGRPATTIKGDATLRPDDGIAVMEIRPTSIVAGQEKTVQHPGLEIPYSSEGGSGDALLDAINSANIQPSVTEDYEIDSSTVSTEPLLLVPDVETGSLKPTGLLKVLDSTTSLDGTTTHYKSLIYGTYIGTNYAQIIHTSSNVYFFPDEATRIYDTEDTTVDYGTTVAEDNEGEQETTFEVTTGTTPRAIATSEETPEINELTTPLRDTTDSVLTTLKDILESARRVLGTTESAAPVLNDEIPNDILPGDPQGRSIKGGSPKNDLGHNRKEHGFTETEEKPTLATRILPSTVYKTFTYFTTFFIPDGVETTTSIRSREVVSSEVTYLTELIQPSETTAVLPTVHAEPTTIRTAPSLISAAEEEQTTKQDEEIELIFKTLYTTYTYLTTFFQENTSSVSSREVVETNVITQTVGPNGVSAVVAGLFEKDESVAISSTRTSESILPSVVPRPEQGTEKYPTTLEQTTEDTLTTLQEQDTTTDQNIPTESEITVNDFEDTDRPIIEPSPTPVLPTESAKEQIKTYYTTYTYFTTIFVDDETEIETRTEVFTNVVTETIQPTAVVPATQETLEPTTPKVEQPNQPAVPPEILAYLEALQRQKSQEEALLLAKKAQQQAATGEDENTTAFEARSETTESSTTVEDKSSSENLFRGFEVNAQVTPNPPVEGEVLGSMVTDVVSSSSSGGGTVLDAMDKRNAVPEDQELSESNHHDVEPAPTLLLQTSYTTFTYFTTMYKGDETNVVSRLETVTNVATETIRPTAVVPVETSTLPVTYFTTFTYWTTFYKAGDTVTTSREETVSNVVTPGIAATPTVELGVIMTYRPTTSLEENGLTTDKESKITAENEVTPSDIAPTETSKTEETSSTSTSTTTTSKDVPTVSPTDTSTVSPEPTTYYTTYTYFTTSYIGNETILNSRLETVTSVSIPEVVATQQVATGRAIDGPVYQQSLATEAKPVTPSKVTEQPKIGLISTIRSSQVNDGTTTHYTTDVHGTYIDGLYAQVVESSTRIEKPPVPSSSVPTPVLPTGVLSLNKGSVVDADEITTIYFTTKQIGTLFDGLYAKVIESTSSTKIDAERKATVSPVPGHRTGLVRLIQGQIENNGTTTYYQSKVIGTSIEGRYAQIIESTSSFLSATPTINIAPTSTLPPTKPTEIPEISPSPAVIQSSLSEDPTTESPDQEEDSEENEEEEEEDEEGKDGQSSKKKSRLTFSTKKRSFTPAIRPFASRNRPTFNPKRKGAQGATTITRTDITPTITATLAGKGNRFASSRGRISSPIGPYSSTLSPSGSRRFAGRRVSPNTASSYASTVPGSTRGRQQSRISPSSVFQGNRRGPTSIRGSSARAATRASSSAFPGASTRYRSPIRPSSTLLRGQATVRHDDQENDANEYTTTTLITEETPYTEDIDGGETVTALLQTTTESSRRSTNPLLRFRRPINLNNSGRTATTARSPTTTRRNGNLNRPTSPTVPKVSNSRSNGRTTVPISTRPRQSGIGLFPPRGLFGKKQELPTEEQIEPNEELENDGEENFEDEPVEEIVDNDYEGSEHEDRTTNVNRRSGKSVRPSLQARPFTRGRRTRRQASQLRSYSSRFRRPSQPGSSKAEDKANVTENTSSKEDTGKSATKPIARYNNRGRSLTTSRPPPKTANNPEKTSAESTELSQSKVRPRAKQSNGDRTAAPRIKPSPASNNGRQFTLREKDGASSSRSNYKRPSASGTRNNGRSTSTTDRVRPPRLKNGSNKSSESSSSNSRRVPPSRAPSRPATRNGSRRGTSSSRSKGSLEDIRESPTVYPDYDGTITVTHYVPTEVTIPVVNNGITEHRNIITAQPSTEVLAPSQYSTVTGGDGRPLVVIVSEVTGTNVQGQTEVTRFLLHETPTTRVSHTLTTLGGRRASQSVIVPTTVYSVENVVSTVQSSLSGNAPLANILLSQLLLGQLGQANPLLQPQGTPSTQYNTRTTSYVTTITKQQSTVIPLTFRGKEILTTLVDTSTGVVTATEFITDTVVVTPTAALPAANLNSLLLLLQQPQQSSKNPNPLLDPLFAATPFTQSNTLPGEVERRHQPADSDYKQDSYEYSDDEDARDYKSSRPRNSRGKSNEKKDERSAAPKEESSVVTLYVSGRRPGEFSTVLSTVKVTDTVSSSRKRRAAGDDTVEVRPSVPPSLHAGPEEPTILAGSEDTNDAHAPTESLESVVGDVGRHISTSILA
ncbi:mucin-5AC-like [Colletes gigas]|uniref:mucin-5AC-like n=1 Tax=Colletes gigas TaxID=935657 RepID=UPI001C9A3750|nr:mucin-5AC-like [Colletes gigas]